LREEREDGEMQVPAYDGDDETEITDSTALLMGKGKSTIPRKMRTMEM